MGDAGWPCCCQIGSERGTAARGQGEVQGLLVGALLHWEWVLVLPPAGLDM